MRSSTISIQVSPEVAKSFSGASPQRQDAARKLIEALFAPKPKWAAKRFLALRAQAVSAAERKGLTQEMLSEMLDEAG